MWRNFPWIWNENWSHGNMVLIGDALHTAHFSIGSGTRLAIEDAIALTKALEAEDGDRRRPRPLPGRTQADRAEAGDGGAHQRRLVRTFSRTHEARPDGFAYSYITRSGRIADARLRAMSPEFMARYEAEKNIGSRA